MPLTNLKLVVNAEALAQLEEHRRDHALVPLSIEQYVVALVFQSTGINLQDEVYVPERGDIAGAILTPMEEKFVHIAYSWPHPEHPEWPLNLSRRDLCAYYQREHGLSAKSLKRLRKRAVEKMRARALARRLA